jgi:hypothetical protein
MNALLRKSKSISATPSSYVKGTTGTSNGTVTSGTGGVAGGSSALLDPKSIEAAVFAYLQARRALGVTQISSVEIAGALGLVRSIVETTLRNLKSRGVKLK